jgi:signal transduction histidine kinase
MTESSRLSEKALAALHRAALSITSEVALEKVLQQIVDSARELADARYAALGVPGPEGYMEKFITSGVSKEVAAVIPHRPLGLGLLGAIIEEARSIRLPDISRDPRSVGYPTGHPAITSFLGVPIKAGRDVLGNLYLTDKQGPAAGDEASARPEFTAADQALVEMLAAHAAVAIQNARLYEQVGRLAIIEERSRIGMDLHDGVIQSIYAVGLTLESARLMLPDDPEGASGVLLASINSLNDVIRDIRNFILDLRPQRFSGDLNQALARLVREFQANALVPVEFAADSALLSTLPVPLARTVFLTTQEALANIARHARARNVTVHIQQEGEALALTVQDDGRGFNVDEQAQAVGHGLANMRARAEERHGTFAIRSSPGRGTTVRLRLPTRAGE